MILALFLLLFSYSSNPQYPQQASKQTQQVGEPGLGDEFGKILAAFRTSPCHQDSMKILHENMPLLTPLLLCSILNPTLARPNSYWLVIWNCQFGILSYYLWRI